MIGSPLFYVIIWVVYQMIFFIFTLVSIINYYKETEKEKREKSYIAKLISLEVLFSVLLGWSVVCFIRIL